MSSEKKVLIVSKEQGLKDLGDLVLQFNTDIAPRIPDDYSELYDAIVLYSVPENITELFSNYEIPVIATDNLAEQIEKQGYSALASICPREKQIDCLQALLKRKDNVKAPWKRIQTNFKIKYGDLDSRLATMVREGIPKYEAFFTFIEQNTENLDGIINEPMIPFTRVHAELVKNLELCERFKGGPNEAYFYAEALENLKEYLDHARKRREHLTTMLKLTGPSIGGGSHYLYVDLKEASKEQPEFSFLKHVLDKEKIPHQVIADIIYHDAKHFGNKEKPIRLAASMIPIQYENASYLVREGIIGPDLEDIFLLIRRRIAKGDHKVPWLRSFRDAATQQVMKDIAYWQKNAPQISAAEIPQNPDGIVEHLQRNLNAAFETYSRYLPPTDVEKTLWAEVLKIYNPQDLDLSPETIKRHFDASTSNIKVFTGSIKTPTIDDLISIAGSKGGKFRRHSKKNIAARMYYVDTGFTYAHEDEDFFHLACSFGLHEDGRSPEEKLAAINNYYNQFKSIRAGNTKPSATSYNLHGFYRCFVSGHLNINTYERENKSAKHVRERITHRLGLAEEFARVASIGVATSGIYGNFPEEKCNDPATIIESIHAYPLLSQDNPAENQSEILRSINIRRIAGLRYFARKFGSIRPQYQPASQPASQ